MFLGSQQELKSSAQQAFYQSHLRPSNVLHIMSPRPLQLGFKALSTESPQLVPETSPGTKLQKKIEIQASILNAFKISAKTISETDEAECYSFKMSVDPKVSKSLGSAHKTSQPQPPVWFLAFLSLRNILASQIFKFSPQALPHLQKMRNKTREKCQNTKSTLTNANTSLTSMYLPHHRNLHYHLTPKPSPGEQPDREEGETGEPLSPILSKDPKMPQREKIYTKRQLSPDPIIFDLPSQKTEDTKPLYKFSISLIPGIACKCPLLWSWA